MAYPSHKTRPPGPGVGLGRDLKSRVERYERRLIQAALAANGGNQARAADALGILATTLHEKMKRLDIHLSPPVRKLDESELRQRLRLETALAEAESQVKRAAAALNIRVALVRLPEPGPSKDLPPRTASEPSRHSA